MDTADIEALDAAESSYAARTSSIAPDGANGHAVAGTNGVNGDAQGSGKKKMRITCMLLLMLLVRRSSRPRMPPNIDKKAIPPLERMIIVVLAGSQSGPRVTRILGCPSC